MWFTRENTGLLETLDSENSPLQTGMDYLLDDSRVRIIKEWVCEGGITPEPFTLVSYEKDGKTERIKIDCEWEFNESSIKIPYYHSPFKAINEQ